MPYRDVLAKYERAQKHIKDFLVAADAFRESNRDCVGIKTDEQTGDAVYYVQSVPVVPDTMSLILGDALHNLRSTLDHLAYAVVRPDSEKSKSDTNFPIGNDVDHYSSLADRYIGARQPCRQIIDRLQPYKGGSGGGHYLWQLHRLDIFDKHRLLVAVSFAPVARTLTPSEREVANAKFNKFGNVVRLSVPHWMVGADAPSVPLQKDQVLKAVPAQEAQHEIRFSFDVAIHEPSVVKPTPALLFLDTLASEVSIVINHLAPCATI